MQPSTGLQLWVCTPIEKPSGIMPTIFATLLHFGKSNEDTNLSLSSNYALVDCPIILSFWVLGTASRPWIWATWSIKCFFLGAGVSNNDDRGIWLWISLVPLPGLDRKNVMIEEGHHHWKIPVHIGNWVWGNLTMVVQVQFVKIRKSWVTLWTIFGWKSCTKAGKSFGVKI
jgi:hypothetical protein